MGYLFIVKSQIFYYLDKYFVDEMFAEYNTWQIFFRVEEGTSGSEWRDRRIGREWVKEIVDD